MGSDLYSVTCVSVSERRVALEVRVEHPDAMSIPPDPGFALMVLRDAASDDDPLAREVSYEDALDESWMGHYALGFIRSVEVTDITNAPPPDARKSATHEYWEKPEAWMRGTMTIEVTDPAWIGHLRPGATWSSRNAGQLSVTPDGAQRPAGRDAFWDSYSS